MKQTIAKELENFLSERQDQLKSFQEKTKVLSGINTEIQSLEKSLQNLKKKKFDLEAEIKSESDKTIILFSSDSSLKQDMFKATFSKPERSLEKQLYIHELKLRIYFSGNDATPPAQVWLTTKGTIWESTQYLFYFKNYQQLFCAKQVQYDLNNVACFADDPASYTKLPIFWLDNLSDQERDTMFCLSEINFVAEKLGL